MAQDPSSIFYKPYFPDNLHTWARLESRPRTDDFVRSLKAEIRDPLWMLTRQWQWGEFKGEDTGSAKTVEVKYSNNPVVRLSKDNKEAPSGQHDIFGSGPNAIPMETVVEQLPVVLDVKIGIKIGLRWKKILSDPNSVLKDKTLYETKFRNEKKVIFIEDEGLSKVDEAKFNTNLNLSQVHRAVKFRTIDGRRIYDYLKEDNSRKLQELYDIAGMDPSDVDELELMAQDLVKWVDTIYAQPGGDGDAWRSNQMEYNFACSVATKSGASPEVLVSDEYYHGQLDWYAFELDKADNANVTLREPPTSAEEAALVTSHSFQMLPNEIKFFGMPADRWWEMEAGQVNFGNLDVETTDLSSMLLAEFGLVYGNEWSVIPIKVPVGSLTSVQSIVVTDVFEGKTLIEEAGKAADQGWEGWSMFSLSDNNSLNGFENKLFVPPVLYGTQEGSTVEQVNFIRDEIANMVWGIEKTIPNELGEGMDAFESTRKYINSLNPDDLNTDLAPIEGVFAQYVLSTKVPENWVPFIPVNVSGLPRDINLRRGRMPRIIPGVDVTGDEFITPRSILLNEVNPLYLNEEEVPREGAVVKGNYQRVRWYDGKTYLWYGRRKTSGRGEGSSGLRFDQLEETEYVTPTGDTPVITPVCTISFNSTAVTGMDISWTVDNESGVKEYRILDASNTLVDTITDVGVSTYTYTVASAGDYTIEVECNDGGVGASGVITVT